MSRVTPRTLVIVLAISALTIIGWLVTRGDESPLIPRQDDLLATPQDDLLPGEVLSDVPGNFPEDEILLESDVLEGESDPDDEFLQEPLDNPRLFPNLSADPDLFEGDLDGYLLIGNVGDAATIDESYLPRNYDTELPGFNFSDSAQPSGLPPGSLPGSRIGGASAFLSSTDDATRSTLYNNTEFGCGETKDRHRTICASGGPIESDQLTVIVLFEGAVPVDDTGNQQFTYALVLDADGARNNNYVAQPPFDWDTYQGSDYWIELIGENNEWRLQVTNWAAGDERGTTISAARAAIRDQAIFFIVPLADLPGTPTGYRATTFVTQLDRMFDPAVSGTDAFPGPPNFGLNPISPELTPIVIDGEG